PTHRCVPAARRDAPPRSTRRRRAARQAPRLQSIVSSCPQNRNFAASCTLNGSPAPMPGALFALRVLVMMPKLVELDRFVPGLAQLIVLNRLKTSRRSCTDAPPCSLVVLNTDTSTVLKPGPYSA